MLNPVRSFAMLGIALGVTLSAGTTLAGQHGHGGPPPPPQPHPLPQPPSREVPEIGGTQAGAGLTLALGGLAVVLGRRRRKLA